MTLEGDGAPAGSSLSDAQYLTLAAELLAGIERQVDAWLQTDVVDIDAARTGGLLELSFPDGSRIVVNTQPPLHEVWLAARRGGYHYKHAAGLWCDTKGGDDFWPRLSQCTSEQAGKALVFEG